MDFTGECYYYHTRWYPVDSNDLPDAENRSGGQHTMQPLLQDIFRDTIDKTKQLGMWEKLTIKQRETLVSKYLLEHYNKKRSQQKIPAMDGY